MKEELAALIATSGDFDLVAVSISFFPYSELFTMVRGAVQAEANSSAVLQIILDQLESYSKKQSEQDAAAEASKQQRFLEATILTFDRLDLFREFFASEFPLLRADKVLPRHSQCPKSSAQFLKCLDISDLDAYLADNLRVLEHYAKSNLEAIMYLHDKVLPKLRLLPDFDKTIQNCFSQACIHNEGAIARFLVSTGLFQPAVALHARPLFSELKCRNDVHLVEIVQLLLSLNTDASAKDLQNYCLLGRATLSLPLFEFLDSKNLLAMESNRALYAQHLFLPLLKADNAKKETTEYRQFLSFVIKALRLDSGPLPQVVYSHAPMLKLPPTLHDDFESTCKMLVLSAEFSTLSILLSTLHQDTTKLVTKTVTVAEFLRMWNFESWDFFTARSLSVRAALDVAARILGSHQYIISDEKWAAAISRVKSPLLAEELKLLRPAPKAFNK